MSCVQARVKLRLLLPRVVLSPDPPSQHHILGHQCHSLGVDGTQQTIFKQCHQVGLSSLLESMNGSTLEPEITLGYNLATEDHESMKEGHQEIN